MPEKVKQLTKEDVAYLNDAATDASPEDVVAARELALEAGATESDGFHVEIRDESSGETEVIDVKKIGSFTVGQEIADDQNSRIDNRYVKKV